MDHSPALMESVTSIVDFGVELLSSLAGWR